MQSAADRLLLIICCLVFIPANANEIAAVVSLLYAITISATNGYNRSDKAVITTTTLYIFLCIVSPAFCTFLPLVCYDAMDKIKRTTIQQDERQFPPHADFSIAPPNQGSGTSAMWVSLVIGALAISLARLSFEAFLTISALMAVSYALVSRRKALEYSQNLTKRLRDDTYERTVLLAEKNRELLEKQDYEVRLATLNERGRIAREIHDHVGHLLSRSILQIGALMVTETDEKKKENLDHIRDTLSQAMDSIRTSVHGLHDESIDLKTQVQAITKEFTFCQARTDYRLQNEPDKAIAYCFIAVIKEALNNVARHSNATLVTITLVEHPALYQLVIQDNGTNPQVDSGEGLGLRSIEDRVRALDGQFVVERERGFRLFISIPKRREFYASTHSR